MKFQSGILGVIVVVIALIGTVFGGYILNVESTTVTATDYDRVTDVSSLYDYSSQPDYIEYNPAKNFTGYKLSDGQTTGVSYTQSSTMNQYFMGSTNSLYTTYNVSSLIYTSSSARHYWVFGGNGAGNYNAFICQSYGGYSTINYIQCKTIFENLLGSRPANTETITLTFPASSCLFVPTVYNSTTNDFIISTGEISQGGIWSALDGFLNSYNPYGQDFNGRTFYSIDQITISYTLTGNSISNNDVVTIRYNNQFSQTVNIQNAYLSSFPFSNYGVINNVTVPSNNVNYVGSYPYSNSGDYNIGVTYSYSPVYYYMNPSYGVSISNVTPALYTRWSNDKNNGDVQIVFGRTSDDCHNTLSFNNDVIDIKHESGENYIRINSGNWVYIGNWVNFVLDINLNEGTVSIIPITDFSNYQNFTVVDSAYIVGNIEKQSITDIRWSSTDSSYTFSVYRTLVNMTYNLVMINPSLDITNYFPVPDGFKLDLYNFTILGDTLTINGITFYGDSDNNPISQTGFLHIDLGEDLIYDIKLSNLSVYVDNYTGHTYIADASGTNTKYDLGETVSSTISGSGNWYFSTEFFEGHLSLVDVYNWNWANNLTSTQSIIIWLGLIVTGSLIARRFFDFGALDLAIVIASSIILYSILGVF